MGRPKGYKYRLDDFVVVCKNERAGHTLIAVIMLPSSCKSAGAKTYAWGGQRTIFMKIALLALMPMLSAGESLQVEPPVSREVSVELLLELAAEPATVSDSNANEGVGCVGSSTQGGWDPACNFFTAVFATRSPLDGDTMYGVHMFFIALPGAMVTLTLFAWIVRYESKRRYCFGDLKRDGSFKDVPPDEIIGSTNMHRLDKKWSLWVMLAGSVLTILLCGWNYASAIEYTRFAGAGVCDLNVAMRNVSYVLDKANEEYEVLNPNPAPFANGTSGGNSPADVLGGLANTFEKAALQTTQSCPTGSSASFAPFICSIMSIVFLLAMVAGISGVVSSICGGNMLLNNVGSISALSAAMLFLMFTIFFSWSCSLADSCPVARPYMTHQYTKGVKLGALDEVQSETLYLFSCQRQNRTTANTGILGNVIGKYERDWCGADGTITRIRQNLKVEQDRTPTSATDKKKREEKIFVLQGEIRKYLTLCEGVSVLKDCTAVKRAVDRSLKISCGLAFSHAQGATFSSLFLGLSCLGLAFGAFEKAKYEPKNLAGPLEYDQYGERDQESQNLLEPEADSI